MRKIVIITIILALLTGFTIADPGINQTPESQGITTATTLDVVGNAASTTDIQWRITNDPEGLVGVPDLEMSSPRNWRNWERALAYYASTYSEETYTNGVGLIAYDKNLDVETSEQLSGQWNIDADKQIEFVGVDGARVYSDEYIMVDGVGNFSITEEQVLCVFPTPLEGWRASIFPANCNFAEAGSTIDMTMANVRTNSMDRFITPSADTSVELGHNLLVTELIDGVPSSGTGSAFMNVLIMEARGIYEGGTPYWDSPLSERIEFRESTSITGDITVFDKVMNYNSVYTGSGEINTNPNRPT
ncbi:MAG: hypothetical protein PHR63_10200 [Methanoregulaceae archaeon]|nr:hypothetical protein [Methanoregulaceae archaeon]